MNIKDTILDTHINSHVVLNMFYKHVMNLNYEFATKMGLI